MTNAETRTGPAHWNRVVIPERVKQRAYEKWEADGDCWISTYSTSTHGYAQIGWASPTEKQVVLAHRAAWEHVHGPVGAGMTIDHLCKQRRCVNPDHLRVLDNFENARRTRGRDWPLGQCVNGHPNSELHTQPSGKIVCAPCLRNWRAKHEAKKKAA